MSLVLVIGRTGFYNLIVLLILLNKALSFSIEIGGDKAGP
jgi:hypothetical protein